MKRIAPFAGWAALFLLFSALFFYIAVPHEKEVILPLAVAGVIFALSFAFAKREALNALGRIGDSRQRFSTRWRQVSIAAARVCALSR